ncbi:MAG: 2-oxo acid dehydrogenase subunit E2 [Flavobacteriaceae bacterium]|jgi:pyruvate dehydrogenase E2 component (dihydrolipoamide acetyltransferase)|nr:2-oxo acid dehydrogenase subunit E2 [Flavobacteriaceae bacterium]
MATIINMPRLSDTMEEGTVASWLKQVGDKIEEGDILAEIETDKATMEFESFHEGTLLHIGVQAGETAPVDVLLAIIGDEGEDVSALLNADAPSEETKEEAVVTATEAPSEPEVAAIPEGVEIINMPRLSDTMEEGTVASWLKQVGDAVEEGDILAEIETDKATMEFESFFSGTLLHIGIQVGETAAVDTLLAIIGPEGTDVAAILAAPATTPKPTASEPTAVAAPVQTEIPVETPAVAATVATPAPVTTSNGRIMASPLAKKIAKEKGIDLNLVTGTGESGRIVKRDVEQFSPPASIAASPAQAAVFVPAGQEKQEEIPNSQMRKTIAKRLGASKFSAPHYYLSVEFDMDAAIAFRKQYNSIPDTKISFNDIVVKAVALALKAHPQVNSQWFDDKMVLNHHVHVGVAVAVEDGLVVPVLKFANEMNLPQIGSQVRDFAGRARSKKLTPQEMDGSTFTVSNLGMFGIDEFTSIINQPNSAILSVGAIVQKPVVREGEIVVGNTMKLTLACDHRTVDGATGAQFLQTLKEFIENPIRLVV